MLTIIAPIYNVEKYIHEFIDSIMINDVNIQYIFVDDGSKDKSIDIVKSETINYNNVRILTKENGGLSDARNFGLKQINQGYVFFADSDDTVEIKNLIRLYEVAKEKDLDVCYGDYLRIDEQSNIDKKIYNHIKLNDYVSGDEYLKKSFDGKYLEVSVWRGIYKYDFLKSNNISFIKGLYHEDVLFTFHVLKNAKRIFQLNIPIYHYRQRIGSIMSTKNTNKGKSILFISNELFMNQLESNNKRVWNVYNKYLVLNALRNYGMIDKNIFWKVIRKKGWNLRLIVVLCISLFKFSKSQIIERLEYEKDSIYN